MLFSPRAVNTKSFRPSYMYSTSNCPADQSLSVLLYFKQCCMSFVIAQLFVYMFHKNENNFFLLSPIDFEHI